MIWPVQNNSNSPSYPERSEGFQANERAFARKYFNPLSLKPLPHAWWRGDMIESSLNSPDTISHRSGRRGELQIMKPMITHHIIRSAVRDFKQMNALWGASILTPSL